MYFDHHLCFFQLNVTDKEELFKIMAGKLHDEGFVKENYLNGIISREKDYPTAIEINNIGFAIPHTDSTKVNNSQICFASLEKPVIFQSMTDKNQDIAVNFVFMLAMSQPHEHAETLQNMVALFQDKVAVNKLKLCHNVKDFTQILTEAKIY